jgi:predicted aconitase
MDLSPRDRELLSGRQGPALQMAMRTVVRVGEIAGAARLIDVGRAHIDACFYNGQAHIDFARDQADHGARVGIPTWTNACPVSLADPDVRPAERHPELVAGARRLMALYVELGCQAVWTCAPYHLPDQPALGDHIVESESNAVIYYNSVVGARTNKYGDFLDVCAAITGRVPLCGLHADENRRGDVLFDLAGLPQRLLDRDVFFPVLGHLVGREAGSRVPVIEGLPAETSPDRLRAMSAAIGASGGATMFHAVGVTPEAPSLEAAFRGRAPGAAIPVTMERLLAARDSLSTAAAGPVDFIALGTPHFSLSEFAALLALIDGRRVRRGVRCYVTTSRHVRAQAAERGWIAALARAGVRVIVDTCTYFSQAVAGCRGRAMTNSAKWAYYAPGMLGVEVVFASLEECVESAVRGEVWRDPGLWRAGAGTRVQ